MTYQDKPPLDELYDELYHHGVPGRSGRYRHGSGENPHQHCDCFICRVAEYKRAGLNDAQIAKTMGMKRIEYNAKLTIAKDEQRALDRDTALGLQAKGYGATEIARQMGYKSESSIRALLDDNVAARKNLARETADRLKEVVDEKKFIDVGTSVEKELGVSKEKLNIALEMLKEEGYHVYGGRTPQVTNSGKLTTLRVLTTPDKEHKEIFEPGVVKSFTEYASHDGGETFKKLAYPKSMDSKRLMIRYAEDGGIDKDGIIELRRGVDDLSLGNARYSQVRILVDNDRYLKGMAIYSDDMPDGVDVIFNTNKKKDVPMRDVLKEIKNDPDNPFGSLIKPSGQSYYKDKDGNEQLSLINKRADEGDWSDWSNKVPAQFLSKQPLKLAKQQLKMAIDDKVSEYESICALENPTVKKKLLESFSTDCDSAAVHLQAAAFPRQKYHVIIPVNALKDNEVYAPKYKNGERLALVRYPHEGTFQIPILTVNNRNKTARSILPPDVDDAVGINAKVAERLSGADFDGDTVMAIPISDKVNIKNSKPLEGLMDYDPKIEYATVKKGDDYYSLDGRKVSIMSKAATQNEMGRASNLITDMTLRGATEAELAKATRHSMTVIDAHKHKLDYKRSYVENDIATLKKKYQGRYDENGRWTESASTLISRAKGQASVFKTKGSPKINMKGDPDYDPTRPEGALIYKLADELYHPERSYDKQTGLVTIRTTDRKKITYDRSDKEAHDYYNPVKKVDPDTGEVSFTNKDGSISYKLKPNTKKSTQMAETDDAYTLISEENTDMERAYADYANKMKSLANQARKEMMTTGNLKYSSEAKKKYQKEVKSLEAKLNTAEQNAPRERQAQIISNANVKAKEKANPDMTKAEKKKLAQQELDRARHLVGAKRITIDINDAEWEAIQSGAISENKLKRILNNTDIDVVRQKATPRELLKVTPAKGNKAKAMQAMGYTLEEIAKATGLSASTISNYLQGKE